MNINDLRSEQIPEPPKPGLKENLTNFAGNVLHSVEHGLGLDRGHHYRARLRNTLLLILVLTAAAVAVPLVSVAVEKNVTNLQFHGILPPNPPALNNDPNRPPVFATQIPPTPEPFWHIQWP